MYALIDNDSGFLVSLLSSDDPIQAQPEQSIVPAPINTEFPVWNFKSKKWTKNEAKHVAKYVAARVGSVNSHASEAANRYTSSYTPHRLKYEEAMAFLSDKDFPTPLLSAEASETGENLKKLAAAIVKRATADLDKVGKIEGLRRSWVKKVSAAKTMDDVMKMEQVFKEACWAFDKM